MLQAYVLELACISTLTMKGIQSGTIALYLRAVIELLQRATHVKNYAKEGPTNQNWIAPIDNILKEMKRWEAMPDRREPVTPEMLESMQYRASLPSSYQDSRLAAMADWTEVNLFAGCRVSEWAQRTSRRGTNEYEICGDREEDGTQRPLAFTLRDIQFRIGLRQVSHEEALRSPDLVDTCIIHWFRQKNGTRGQLMNYTRFDDRAGNIDLVSPMLRIVARFERLYGLSETNLPISIYADKAGKPQFLCTPDIETELRSAAKHAHNVTNEKQLQKWGTHSMRVGACVLLWASGAVETTIKQRLRWKSDSYMMYLRNIRFTADAHTLAINQISLRQRNYYG